MKQLRLVLWFLTGIVLAFSCLHLYRGREAATGVDLTLFSRGGILIVAYCLFVGAFWLVGLLLQIWAGAANFGGKVLMQVDRIPLILRVFVVVLCLLLPVLAFYSVSQPLVNPSMWLGMGLNLLVSIMGGLVIMPHEKSFSRLLLVITGLAILGGVFFTAGSYFTLARDYPFSLYWSEGNRLYDYSLMFGAERYQHSADEPLFAFTSRGRQFIYGLIYLLPNVGIKGVRIWQGAVWSFMPILFGWIAAARLLKEKNQRLVLFFFGLWSLLFINQGPVYAQLILSAMLVAIAVYIRPLPLSAALVILATWYAYISRWTWSYAPGLWAGLLALLAITDPKFSFKDWRRLVRPLVLGLAGLITVQAVQWINQMQNPVVEEAVSAAASGNGRNLVDMLLMTVSSQPLIFKRLLPSTLYAPGILAGSVVVALPVLLFLFYMWKKGCWQTNAFQRAAVLVIAGIFWAAGLLASTKVGGGNNLHNLDMLWMTLILVLSVGLVHSLPKLQEWLEKDVILWVLLLLMVLVPLMNNYTYSYTPLKLPGRAEQEEYLQHLQGLVDAVTAKDEQVLFIDQRQLITFGKLSGFDMIDDYEKKVLMENAMSQSAAYFEGFYTDLMSDRFSLIITEPINLVYKNEGDGFDYENNVWVQWVGEPLTCYWEVLETNKTFNIQILVPRQTPLSAEEAQSVCPEQ